MENILNGMSIGGMSTGEFIENYGKSGLIIGSLLIIVLIYFVVIYERVPRQLRKMEVYKNLMTQNTLTDCTDLIGKNYVLSDFYVLSSYKSYLPCEYYYDYAHLDAISVALKYGARFIDLDIYNETFDECTNPVVCYGKEEGQWKYTTVLSLEDVLTTIADHAFTPDLINNTDPLFLNLNIRVEQNYTTINKIAKLVSKTFSERLLPMRFSYQGRYSQTKIALEPIDSFAGKVIILADKDFRDTDLDELVNISPGEGGNLRELTITDIIQSTDIEEIKTFNKTGFTRITPPPILSRDRGSYNYIPAWYSGCQFINMNLQKVDAYTISYMKRFKNSSLVLKPLRLRYKRMLIEPPKPQDKAVDMSPKRTLAPDGTILTV